MQIRQATAEDMAEVGEIRITAYVAGGFLSADSGYVPHLRALRADGNGQGLVAVAPGQQAADGQAHPADPAGADPAGTGRLLGTIMLQVWPHTGQTVKGPGEAELRPPAVRPGVQGGGVGELLLQACEDRAKALRLRKVFALTTRAAHWFLDQGFVAADVSALPVERRELYNWKRGSKVFVKRI